MTNVKMPKPVGYFECDPETLEPIWGDECISEDNIYGIEETCTIGRAIIFADQAQAYADERVREAQTKLLRTTYWIEGSECAGVVRQIRDEIRALISKEKA